MGSAGVLRQRGGRLPVPDVGPPSGDHVLLGHVVGIVVGPDPDGALGFPSWVNSITRPAVPLALVLDLPLPRWVGDRRPGPDWSRLGAATDQSPPLPLWKIRAVSGVGTRSWSNALRSRQGLFPGGSSDSLIPLRWLPVVALRIRSGEGGQCARVAEQADAQDLKSCGGSPPCGFDSHSGHF